MVRPTGKYLREAQRKNPARWLHVQPGLQSGRDQKNIHAEKSGLHFEMHTLGRPFWKSSVCEWKTPAKCGWIALTVEENMLFKMYPV